MASLRPIATALGALSALAGCATLPAQHLAPVASAARLDQRSLADPGLNAFLAASGLPANGRWDLDRLTPAALYFHPDITIADAELAMARAGVATARERSNPTANFSLEHASPADLASPWTIGAAIGLVLELFRKRGDRAEQARDLERAARHDIAATAWRVRSGVRSAMLDMRLARGQRMIAQQQLAAETELARMLGDRLRLGAASSIDMAQAETARQQAALAVSDAEHQLAASRAALATAVGVPLAALDGVTIDDSAFDRSPPLLDLASLRKAALTDRADVQAALARYDAADAAVRLEAAKRFPDITLGPSYSYDQGQNKIGLNADAALPIFNQNGGSIAEAQARRALAAAQFDALQTSVLGAIDAAQTDYRSSAVQVATADGLVDSERSRVAQLQRQLAEGAIARPVLLAAQANLLSTEQARLAAQVSREKALGALEDAVHAPLIGGLASLPALSAMTPAKDVQ
ncbi:MAG: TolC family protein [Sphingomonas sp.]